MNDRFKFRVFISDKKNSKNSLTGMFKVHSLHTGTNKAIISSLYGNVSIKLENNILMQCTGLKDKNGKLIYEGDIVKVVDIGVLGYVRERIGEVVYGYSFYPAFIIETTLGDVKDFTDDMEVIGNKFENPELLKECE